MRAHVSLALALVVLFAATFAAADEERAPAPVVDLLTMGPGEAVPERFGHAALCVRYPDRPDADRCYDYGLFDGSEPLDLGYRFLRGESVFWVGERRPGPMIRAYERRDRDVWRQTLPISEEDAREMASLLSTDARPENRYYHYHHYFDNCSTRVRDLIDDASGGALSSLPDDALGGEPGARRTFRDFTYEGFAEHPALLLGTDLVLGRAVDVEPDAYELMFLPEKLRHGVEKALGAEPERIYTRRAPPLSQDPGLGPGPAFAAIGLALFAPIALAIRYRRFERAALALAFAPLALMGLVLWTIAVVSPLPEVRYNELFLVFLPLDAAIPFLSRRTRFYYAAARTAGIGLALALALVGAFQQPSGPALAVLFPLLGALWQASGLRERWPLGRASRSARSRRPRGL